MTTTGQQWTLSKLKGHVVLLDFWATWCPPCRAALPHIQKLSSDEHLKNEGLVVAAIEAQDDKSTITTFLEKNKYTFTVPMDLEAKAMGDYKNDELPTTIIIGRDGTIFTTFNSSNPKKGEKELDDAINAALAEKDDTVSAR